ncbi:hypothetical protein E1180_16740 [Roseibium denhamense]|uniref:Cadmium transporter n=1 Tax=Roseibium denhamense TaxID=76305 RepID=A0ABY1P622_9HYPH|nr:hypothetical protein [Roseibium denhamense]MTI07158.1 hypothetical protein [Roseibium denhamense]SMP26817.1 hypothetical protein SAMN06265374_2799 [Roseibium denhamense]
MILMLTVALAYGLTNVDGFFAVLALAAGGRAVMAAIGFLIAHVIVLGSALVLGAGAMVFAPADLGLLGIVPVAFGFREILKNRSRKTRHAPPPPQAGSVLTATLLFLSLSTDTLVVMAAFFADTRGELDVFILLGGVAAIAATLACALAVNTVFKPTDAGKRFFERLAPLVMIAAGVYILMDTQTDMF